MTAPPLGADVGRAEISTQGGETCRSSGGFEHATCLSEATRLPSGQVRPGKATAAGRRIIAVDGEGADVDGRHAYTLLAAADDRGDLWRYVTHDGERRERDDQRQANYGLPTRTCLDFLLDLPRDPTDLVVGFSFSYDVVKILSDLPLENLRELAAIETTDWEGYRIEYRPRKFLTVSEPRYGLAPVVGVDGRGTFAMRRAVTVWDVFGYWNTSFVRALQGTGPDVFGPIERERIIPRIAAMKARRSDFANEDRQTILAYCAAEVTCLARMVRQVVVGTEDAGLVPRAFHGASAIAYTWMRDRGIAGHITGEGVPADVVDAAYFGGRFETSAVGRVGPAHGYDLRSAYAAVLRSLPCLACGSWRRTNVYEAGVWGVWEVGSETSGPWAPFPMRVDRADAEASMIPTSQHDESDRERYGEWLGPLVNRQVIFAHGGRRWCWGAEVDAARAHYGPDAIPVYDGWVFTPGCEHRPFAELDDLYARRLDLEAAGEHGQALVYKLLLANLYGLTAQSVGNRRRKGVRYSTVVERKRQAWRAGDRAPDMSDLYEAPETLCRIWAGMITSGVRALVLDAIYRSGSVVAVATDGIISTEPIPGLEDHGRLGDWKHEQYTALTIYQNGVYTYEQDGAQHMKSRGFSARDITPNMLATSWDAGEWECVPTSGARAFVGLALACNDPDPLEVMGQWVEQSRPVSFIPTKRRMDPRYWLGGRPDLMPTGPFTVPPDLVSLGYVPHHTWADVSELAGWIGDDATDDDLPAAY